MKQLTVAAWQFIGFGSISLGRPAVVGPSERGGRDADTQHPGPGGLRSELDFWRHVQRTRLRRPLGWIRWLDWARNTESSRWTNAMPDVRAPASRPAHIYAADHLALANHLGLGGCIGASFCLTLCELAPSRVTAAVLQNPIGHADNCDVFANLVQTGAMGVRAQRPEIDEHTLNRFGDNRFGGDFVYSVSRQFVRQCKTPLLVMPDDAPPHPKLIGEEIIELAPNVEALRQWKGPEHLRAAIERVTAFLDRHTPR